MTRPTVGTLEQALGYEFRNRELITEALTHRSYRHEAGRNLDNERLEFLGDAVLDLCISEAIMSLYQDKREGQLSKIRSQLVSEASLSEQAQELNLGELLFVGKGEELSGGRQRVSILADTLEAVIAAVYLDGGLEAARNVILKLFDLNPGEQSHERAQSLLDLDAKSRLQEVFQSLGYPAPSYACVKTSGPEHSRVFTMGLNVMGIELCRAKGNTKKEATQTAARDLLEKVEKGDLILLEFMLSKNLEPQRRKTPVKKVKKTKEIILENSIESIEVQNTEKDIEMTTEKITEKTTEMTIEVTV